MDKNEEVSDGMSSITIAIGECKSHLTPVCLMCDCQNARRTVERLCKMGEVKEILNNFWF